ncbi:MAG: hypothetical protein CMA31_02010 [Euryarchaeota archaeon]|nr:hypothetical protein [Euryarchaeota archaeon]|tara:strand:- start:4333 stop:4644 length:312 start_codon:yes stop_codon:yes gene_type:complete
MLIEKTYKVDEVVTIKLKSGEELVGKLEHEDENAIRVHMPLTLVASEKGIGLQQFLFTADVSKAYTIKHEAITLIAATKTEFAEGYTKQTSNIITPQKPSILV